MQTQYSIKNNRKQMNVLSLFLLFVLMACNESDDFYHKLQDTPELYVSTTYSYNQTYAIGDTMFVYGRLNPQNNLHIQIGDADAVILVKGTIPLISSNPFNGYGQAFTLDKIGFLVTTGMGAGKNRPVVITSGGNTIQGPPIEIYARKQNNYPTVPLKLVPYYSRPGATFLNCVNGKGSVYFYANKNFVRIKKGGAVNTYTIDFRDGYGTFSVPTFYSGAVDPQEQTLYFSAQTTDKTPENATNYIYRFCRYNLVTGELTTLNRTLVPKVQQQQTLSTYQPFEGQIGSVRVTKVYAVYADSLGGMFLRIGDYAICRVSPSGNVKYLFKSDGSYPLGISKSVIPGIILTGSANELAKSAVDPNGGRLYLYNFPFDMYSKTTIMEYDLKDQIFLSEYQSAYMNSAVPHITGPFSSLTGAQSQEDMTGLMPFPGDKLIILYYQRQFSFTGVPLWGVLDFANQWGEQYAPGACNMGNYGVTTGDILLNYDEEGQLYMTANNNVSIVKTEAQ